MPCELCLLLPRNVRTTKRHERLQQVGLTKRIARPGRAKAAWITHHVCEICETEWRHVDDPLNLNAGWTIQRMAEVYT